MQILYNITGGNHIPLTAPTSHRQRKITPTDWSIWPKNFPPADYNHGCVCYLPIITTSKLCTDWTDETNYRSFLVPGRNWRHEVIEKLVRICYLFGASYNYHPIYVVMYAALTSWDYYWSNLLANWLLLSVHIDHLSHLLRTGCFHK